MHRSAPHSGITKFAARLLEPSCRDNSAAFSAESRCKWIYVSPDQNDEREPPEVFIRVETVERVHEFLYLGSIVGDSFSLGILEDVTRRIAEATKIHGRLKPIWLSRKMPRNIKRRLFLVSSLSLIAFDVLEYYPTHYSL